MELPNDLLNDLSILDSALGDGSDLAGQLGHVVHLLVESVPTLFGLSITVTVDGYPLVLGVVPDGAATDARATIAITLTDDGETVTATSELTAYATGVAAFVDVKADAVHALGFRPDAITLDGDLGHSPPTSRLADLSLINQAIGVLIDRGHNPNEGRALLEQQAQAAGQTTVDHARAIIADVSDVERPNPM